MHKVKHWAIIALSLTVLSGCTNTKPASKAIDKGRMYKNALFAYSYEDAVKLVEYRTTKDINAIEDLISQNRVWRTVGGYETTVVDRKDHNICVFTMDNYSFKTLYGQCDSIFK